MNRQSPMIAVAGMGRPPAPLTPSNPLAPLMPSQSSGWNWNWFWAIVVIVIVIILIIVIARAANRGCHEYKMKEGYGDMAQRARTARQLSAML